MHWLKLLPIDSIKVQPTTVIYTPTHKQKIKSV